MAKSPDSKYWLNKADAEIKAVTLSLGHCERCRRTDHQLHHHHIITRNNRAYRHLRMNVVCLCAGCHTLRSDSAHNDLTTFLKWLETTDRWAWYMEHTVKSVEIIANQEIEIYKPIKIARVSYQQAYEMLKGE